MNKSNCFNLRGISLKPAKFIADGEAVPTRGGAASIMASSGLLSVALGPMMFAYVV